MSNLPLVACTLDAADRQRRLADWAELFGRATARESSSDGVRYTFAAHDDLMTRVGGLAAAEQRCCSFLEFEIAEAGDEIELTITAPRGGQEVLRSLFVA